MDTSTYENKLFHRFIRSKKQSWTAHINFRGSPKISRLIRFPPSLSLFFLFLTTWWSRFLERTTRRTGLRLKFEMKYAIKSDKIHWSCHATELLFSLDKLSIYLTIYLTLRWGDSDPLLKWTKHLLKNEDKAANTADKRINIANWESKGEGKDHMMVDKRIEIKRPFMETTSHTFIDWLNARHWKKV